MKQDLISRQAAIDALKRKQDNGKGNISRFYNTIIQHDIEAISQLPPAQSEIIYCKDCAKHNKGLGNYEVHPDGSTTWIWKDNACPLVSWRGKAQGHEYDYQYCVYAERKVTE